MKLETMKRISQVLALCVTASINATALAASDAPADRTASPTCGAECAVAAEPPPAPERQSGALMLGGLGAIGFVAHRRRVRSGGRD